LTDVQLKVFQQLSLITRQTPKKPLLGTASLPAYMALIKGHQYYRRLLVLPVPARSAYIHTFRMVPLSRTALALNGLFALLLHVDSKVLNVGIFLPISLS
jgi:hypothetical protein